MKPDNQPQPAMDSARERYTEAEWRLIEMQLDAVKLTPEELKEWIKKQGEHENNND